eukprot:TRINITY_DN4734_c0_g1_i4.p1 TRINITY_DN4734_c0_g1~~TRINITY_DN4734_c0_g1_i4.p1  ORF type:complete len:241 (+),score=25.67 TRINITY_DN4734_c0_g1_i4:152-874(+)
MQSIIRLKNSSLYLNFETLLNSKLIQSSQFLISLPNLNYSTTNDPENTHGENLNTDYKNIQNNKPFENLKPSIVESQTYDFENWQSATIRQKQKQEERRFLKQIKTKHGIKWTKDQRPGRQTTAITKSQNIQQLAYHVITVGNQFDKIHVCAVITTASKLTANNPNFPEVEELLDWLERQVPGVVWDQLGARQVVTCMWGMAKAKFHEHKNGTTILFLLVHTIYLLLSSNFYETNDFVVV